MAPVAIIGGRPLGVVEPALSRWFSETSVNLQADPAKLDSAAVLLDDLIEAVGLAQSIQFHEFVPDLLRKSIRRLNGDNA